MRKSDFLKRFTIGAVAFSLLSPFVGVVPVLSAEPFPGYQSETDTNGCTQWYVWNPAALGGHGAWVPSGEPVCSPVPPSEVQPREEELQQEPYEPSLPEEGETAHN